MGCLVIRLLVKASPWILPVPAGRDYTFPESKSFITYPGNVWNDHAPSGDELTALSLSRDISDITSSKHRLLLARISHSSRSSIFAGFGVD